MLAQQRPVPWVLLTAGLKWVIIDLPSAANKHLCSCIDNTISITKTNREVTNRKELADGRARLARPSQLGGVAVGVVLSFHWLIDVTKPCVTANRCHKTMCGATNQFVAPQINL